MRQEDVLSLIRENSSLKSEILILSEELLGADKTQLLIHPEKEIQNAEVFERAICQLKEGRPLQYILGKWEFAGREFCVGEGVLIPREDTLAVIELSKELVKNKENIIFADLGSGSGAIAVTLAQETGARGYAIEKSQAAFEFLSQNAKMAEGSLELINGDMFEAAKDLCELDLVVSNPPYITADEMKALSKWVLNEPHEALFGGEDGLLFYREIAKCYYPKLKEGGAIALEVGHLQADAVTDILRAEGYKNICEKCDMSGHRRAVGAIK